MTGSAYRRIDWICDRWSCRQRGCAGGIAAGVNELATVANKSYGQAALSGALAGISGGSAVYGATARRRGGAVAGGAMAAQVTSHGDIGAIAVGALAGGGFGAEEAGGLAGAAGDNLTTGVISAAAETTGAAIRGSCSKV